MGEEKRVGKIELIIRDRVIIMGEAAFQRDPCAKADRIADLLDSEGGQIMLRQNVVERACQVWGSIHQCAVEIKQDAGKGASGHELVSVKFE
jgi:hypothetical protein